MKSVNWYTSILCIFGIIALVYSVTHIQKNQQTVFLILVFIIIILEVFPIKLPSGDDFGAGSIVFLFILLHFSFGNAVLVLTVGLIAAFIKIYHSIRIPFFRVLVNIGMYSISLLAAYFFWNMTQGYNLVFSVTLTTFIYEFVNLLLLEFIQKFINNRELFVNIRQQLTELIVPISVYAIVIPILLILETERQIIITILYTLFFLLIVIFFSSQYTKQLSIRKSTSEAFIQILEERITSSLVGHGNRVGIICEAIIEDLDYPKRKRHDLLQAAIMHDIGKALLPAHIFRKRGDLTLSEEREYKTHPVKAVEIVKTMFQNDSFSDWILYHHERWDGKGFPAGLKGEEIPLESRIITFANELDHILSRHEDKETILKLLREKSGTILDPKIVDKVELHHIEIVLENIHPYKEELLEESREAENINLETAIYSNLGESFFIEVTNGTVISPVNQLSIDFIQSLADIAIKRQGGVHETVVHHNQTFDIHAQSFGDGKITIFAHDLTTYLNYRKQLEQNILESYVEIVEVLSGGKIRLHSSKTKLIDQLGEWIAEIPINSNSDVSKSRELTTTVLHQYPSELHTMKVQVAVTEAVTNILKHATGGKLTIFKCNQVLQFLVADKGSGIPLHEIPKTILVSGYSSKRSLGQGFKMISNFSDGVQIYTSTEGTFILLQFNLLEQSRVD